MSCDIFFKFKTNLNLNSLLRDYFIKIKTETKIKFIKNIPKYTQNISIYGRELIENYENYKNIKTLKIKELIGKTINLTKFVNLENIILINCNCCSIYDIKVIKKLKMINSSFTNDNFIQNGENIKSIKLINSQLHGNNFDKKYESIVTDNENLLQSIKKNDTLKKLSVTCNCNLTCDQLKMLKVFKYGRNIPHSKLSHLENVQKLKLCAELIYVNDCPYFNNLIELNINGIEGKNKKKIFDKMPYLKKLIIKCDDTFTDGNIFDGIKCLKILHITSSKKIDDTFLKNLEYLEEYHIYINDNIDNLYISHPDTLCKKINIKNLYFRGDYLIDNNINTLCNLEILELCGCNKLSNNIFTNMKKLKKLVIKDIYNLSLCVSDIPNLKKLICEDIVDLNLSLEKNKLEKLSVISCFKKQKLTKKFFEHLNNLNYLNISYNNCLYLESEFLDYVPNIKYLNINDCTSVNFANKIYTLKYLCVLYAYYQRENVISILVNNISDNIRVHYNILL